MENNNSCHLVLASARHYQLTHFILTLANYHHYFTDFKKLWHRKETCPRAHSLIRGSKDLNLGSLDPECSLNLLYCLF